MKRKRGWGQEKRCQNLSKSVLIQNKAGKLIIFLVTAAVSRQDPSTHPHHKHTHTHVHTHLLQILSASQTRNIIQWVFWGIRVFVSLEMLATCTVWKNFPGHVQFNNLNHIHGSPLNHKNSPHSKIYSYTVAITYGSCRIHVLLELTLFGQHQMCTTCAYCNSVTICTNLLFVS